MVFNLQFDIGQIVITTAIGLVGWSIKRMLEKIESRLDHHDDQIIGLIRDVSGLVNSKSFFVQNAHRLMEVRDKGD